jgi:hypothetical protein
VSNAINGTFDESRAIVGWSAPIDAATATTPGAHNRTTGTTPAINERESLRYDAPAKPRMAIDDAFMTSPRTMCEFSYHKTRTE